MDYSHKCSVPACTGNYDTFQSLPKEPNTRRAVMFVYEKIPVQFDPQLHIQSSNHFTEDSFESLGQCKAAWDNAMKVLLKRGAVPTLCSSQPQVVV